MKTNTKLSGSSDARSGFTLIELTVAVALLILIMLAASSVMSNASQAVTETTAIGEIHGALGAFSTAIRRDLYAVEHDGIMILGARQFSGSPLVYASTVRRNSQQDGNFRVDWIEFLTNTEQAPNVDPRVIGQTGRIFFGHGRLTNPGSSDFKDVATDWVLLRHLYIQRMAGSSVKEVQRSVNSQTDVDGSPTLLSYLVSSYTNRQFQWMYIDGQNLLQVANEPSNYFGYLPSGYSRRESWGKNLLPQCVEFRIEYAMASDLNNGQVSWRQPPKVGGGNPQDPNYRPGDPMHSNQYNTDGRLMFGPGDNWPVLLKFTVTVGDALERVSEATSTVVVKVP